MTTHAKTIEALRRKAKHYGAMCEIGGAHAAVGRAWRDFDEALTAACSGPSLPQITSALAAAVECEIFERDVLPTLAALAEAAPVAAAPDEREAFEAWAEREGFNIHRDDTDKYHDYHRATTRWAWLAWQARAAAPAVPAQVVEALNAIDAVLELPREPNWSYRNTITTNKARIGSLIADIRAALTAQPAATTDAPNLADPAVQKRLAAQWGYVPKSEPESVQAVCRYPDCHCPFDAPADPNWCAKGLPHAATPPAPEGSAPATTQEPHP